MSGPVIVFDSGLGGLTVLREIRRQSPELQLVYCADNAAFPYGAWAEDDLCHRVIQVIGSLVAKYQPGAIVIACNTATTIALHALRGRFSVPFVGTVPAIKVAAEQTGSGMFSVLATPGTIAREYTRALLDEFASNAAVTLVGPHNLAALAEQHFLGKKISNQAVLDEIKPAFVSHGDRRTDCIVLGCTHYPLLLETMRAVAPWNVDFIDPASAIARRLGSILPRDVVTGRGNIFTSTAAIPGEAIKSIRQAGGFADTGLLQVT